MKRQTTRWLPAALAAFLLLAAVPLRSQDLNGYEYWFDQDFDGRIPVNQNLGAVGTLAQTLPVTNLDDGFHTLHIRFRRVGADTLPRWSAVSSYCFFKKEIDPANAHAYEYWYDGNRANLVEGTPNTSGDLLLVGGDALGFDTLADGFHTISLRVRSGIGWSAVSSYRFFKKEIDPNNAHGYEYWYDGNRNSLVEKTLNAPTGDLLLISEDAADGFGALADGFHTITLRVRSGTGWSAASTYRFYKNSNLLDGGISAWEYWWDDQFDQAVRTDLDSPADQILMLDEPLAMDSLCKGKHTLGIRFLGENGWSSAHKYEFIKTAPRFQEEVAAFEVVADGGLVSFVNQSQFGTGYQWFFGDGDTSTTANPFHQYNLGSYEVKLVNYGACQNDTASMTLLVPGVSSYTPKKGGKNATVTMSLTGVGFGSGTEVWLQRSGQSLTPNETSVASSSQMSVRFKFMDAPIGKWDVIVKFSNNQIDTIVDGFTIEDTTYSKISIKITSNWRMRSGVKNPLTITLTNEGNDDARWIPVTVSGFPPGTKIELVNKRLRMEDIPPFENLQIVGDSLPKEFLDDETQKVFRPMVLPEIPAGQPKTIQLQITPPPLPGNQPFEIEAKAGKSLWGAIADGDEEVMDCFKAIARTAVEQLLEDQTKWLQCISGIALTGLDIYETGLDLYYEDPSNADAVADMSSVFYGILQTGVVCAEAAGSTVPIGRAVEALIKMADFYETRSVIIDCLPVFEIIGNDIINLLIGNSFDPNIKTGPGGGSAGHYYATDSGPLVYVIQCENDTSALFAAQTVVIRDTLDITKLDISTFRFTHINVAGYGITLNTASTQFIRDIYLPTTGVIARVSGSLDANVVTWIMRTIDPNTMQITEDPVAGILQPNFDPPEGDASVGFSIHKLPGLSDDVLIENRAVIIFDTNDPIVTNTWGVLGDNVPPTSQINDDELPAMQDSLNVHLKWEGEDNFSQVQFYRIYVSDGGGPYYQWRSYSTDTSGVFTAQPGHSYRFYSIAVDSAGNVEAPPPGFDAEITIGGTNATKETMNHGYFLGQNMPNPFNGQTRIDYSLPEPVPLLVFRVVAVSGVAMREITLRGQPSGSSSIFLEAGELPPGVYFYQLLAPGVRLTKRMVVERY